LEEEFEDTKGVIRIVKLMKDRQPSGQKKRDKKINNDLQNIHIKLKIEQQASQQKPFIYICDCSKYVNMKDYFIRNFNDKTWRKFVLSLL
jgi:nitrate/nitrite-specific signal transduction histidine kinase